VQRGRKVPRRDQSLRAENGWAGDLKVWEAATGKRTLSIPAHTWWDGGVAFHPSQPHIAVTGKGHTLQMYHAETGRLLMSLPTHGYECRTMAFNSDGTRLLTVLGGVARLIDAAPEMSAFGTTAARAEQDPAEAEAALWVLEQGGQVQVRFDDVV